MSTVSSLSVNGGRSGDRASSYFDGTGGQARASEHQKDETELASDQSTKLAYVVIHTVTCDRVGSFGEIHTHHPSSADYFDVPRLFAKDTRGTALRGRQPLPGFYEPPRGACMTVCRRYSCTDYHAKIKDSFDDIAPGIDLQLLNHIRPWYFMLSDAGPDANIASEDISITSETLMDVMKNAALASPLSLPKWAPERHLRAPYDYFYHFRNSLRQQIIPTLVDSQKAELAVLLDYIDANEGPKFDKIDAVFASGIVHRDHFTKLFRPNELIVTFQDEQPTAYISEDAALDQYLTLQLNCWKWEYDGSFRKRYKTISVPWDSTRSDELPLESLKAWPLRLDRSGLQDRLESRGRNFWNCRRQKFVSYDGSLQTIFELQTTNPRYMIDVNTYRQMHPDAFNQELASEREMRDLGIDMNSDEPPEAPFCILLPATILGYGFHDKKWRSLFIENTGEISWNTEAFDRLVMRSSKKEVIKALVTVHLTSRVNADVVDDKGNGLIVLLHGSPGTGKTLTAESVAEIAQKPLYRVTCGDIGTDAESVEKYLDSVLLIGTIWGCVVLLDEADVFLEERQVTDLARNALVSVFLRVLEYYDGILILTSNRVGTFDEAFKSRVQLAVHYPVLNEDDRFEIWGNFIQALRDRKVDMNFDELDRKTKLLARNQLNGRQIRNLLRTASQLAKYKNERLEYKHLEQVIGIANEFEDYLVKTHGHTDEEYAQEQGTRGS